jgi:hypothetical protein
MPQKPKRELLKGTTGVIKSKIIGCNTLELEYDNGNRAIRYHNTDVITMLPNGDTVLDSGGWLTYTTKERLNRRYKVWSKNSVWYIEEPATGNTLHFFDGITFDGCGKVKGEVKVIDEEKIKATKARIRNYVRLADRLKEIPFPDAGDCWSCMMQTKDGQSIGDAFKDTSHLEMHLEEGYLHGSIIYNALKEKGYHNPAVIMQMGIKDSIKRALRTYLTKRLIPEIQAV